MEHTTLGSELEAGGPRASQSRRELPLPSAPALSSLPALSASLSLGYWKILLPKCPRVLAQPCGEGAGSNFFFFFSFTEKFRKLLLTFLLGGPEFKLSHCPEPLF